MANPISTAGRTTRQYMRAVVLGTALTTLSALPALSATAEGTRDGVVADINRYCTVCWRNARLPVEAWSDCTQEVLARLLERLPDDGWTRVLQADGEERREFIRAIDAVKKRVQRARKWTSSLDGVADHRELDSRRLAEERDLVRQTAEELLTPRQQRILQLSFEGWSVQEMADELRLPSERVSDEKYKAIRKLRSHLTEAEEARPAVASALSA
jgi:RNA polymerase sigma factor (sigma-70 family)